MSILNVNKINPVGGGSTITIAGIASVTGNVTATGTITGAHHGDGSNLTNIPAGNLTGTLPAISGANLTGISGVTKIETGNTKAEVIDSGSDGRFIVETEGTEKFRIDSGGEIRLTSENGNNSDTPGFTFRGGSSSQKANFARIHSRMVSNWGGQLQFKVKDDNGSLSDAYQTAMIMDHNGNLQFNSGYGSAATAFGVRAWVQGNSGTTNGSGGLSSMSRVNTGRFQLNFATTMPDDNYAVGCLANNNYSDTSWFDSSETTSVRVYFYSGGSYQDPSEWSAWVIR